MGRFYQTAKPEFVDDFIYQPPWELMNQRLQKEQNDYDVSLGTTDLLGHPDINYIEDEVEKQKVKEIQDEYNNRSLELAQKMQQAGSDWRKYLPEMNKLKRDLESDYKTGRIHNIQTSAANYAEMEKHLSTIKDPVIKEAKKRQLMSQWRENSPNRSIDSIFQTGEVYDRKDLVKEFWDEWKTAQPEIASKAYAYANGKGYLYNGIEEKKYQDKTNEAFNSFLQRPENLSYINQMDKELGLEKYLEEDGKTLIPLTDPRSTAYHMNKYAVQLGDYTQESKKKDINSDNTYLTKLKIEEDRRIARKAELTALQGDQTYEPGKLSNKLLDISDALQDKQNELLQPILTNYKVNGKPAPLQKMKKLILEGGEKKYGDLYKKIKKIEDDINKNYIASKQLLVDKIGATKTDRLLKTIDENWNNNVKVNLGLGDFGNTQVKAYSVEDYNNPNKPLAIGGKKVSYAQYVENTLLPVLIDENIDNSFLQRHVEFTFEDGEVRTIPVYTKTNNFTKR